MASTIAAATGTVHKAYVESGRVSTTASAETAAASTCSEVTPALRRFSEFCSMMVPYPDESVLQRPGCPDLAGPDHRRLVRPQRPGAIRQKHHRDKRTRASPILQHQSKD